MGYDCPAGDFQKEQGVESEMSPPVMNNTKDEVLFNHLMTTEVDDDVQEVLPSCLYGLSTHVVLSYLAPGCRQCIAHHADMIAHSKSRLSLANHSKGFMS